MPILLTNFRTVAANAEHGCDVTLRWQSTREAYDAASLTRGTRDEACTLRALMGGSAVESMMAMHADMVVFTVAAADVLDSANTVTEPREGWVLEKGSVKFFVKTVEPGMNGVVRRLGCVRKK